MKQDDRTHYAVIHPDDPDRRVYWVVNAKGTFKPWPPRITLARHYDPDNSIWKQILVDHDRDRHTASLEFWGKANGWATDCMDIVTADPQFAAEAFAAWSIRCWACARSLTDATSKARGIGPECQAGVPNNVIDRLFVPAVARAVRA